MKLNKKVIFLSVTLSIQIFFLQNASAAVIADNTWQSNFYGPWWGVETVVNCPTGNAVSGLAGKDAEGWVSAGLKLYCMPISSSSEIGLNLKSEQVVKDSDHWLGVNWSSDINCPSGSIASGLRIQQEIDGNANYLLNAGLECKNYPVQSASSTTDFYGQYFGTETPISCPIDYWLTGVSVKQGWGLDGLRVICSKFIDAPSIVIYSSTGSGGMISPSGNFEVPTGSSKTYTIIPANNYQILDVKVDGLSKGIINSYTFSNIQSAHSIEAIFTPYNGNKQSTLGSCNSSSSSANTKSNGQGSLNNAATFCLSTIGPKK